MKRMLAALALVAGSTGLVLAQDAPKPAPQPAAAAVPTLKVGDAAPALSIEKWVKGKELKGFESGRVYVVEFWATWCGPCVASMPHLSELQAEFSADATIVGVTSVDPNNTLEKVEKMAADKGETMAYTVAWDKERQTNTAYMKAAGQRGIPCSFVVDKKGNIAYIGHPMSLDMVLPKVIAGAWDAKSDPDRVKADMEKFWTLMGGQSDDPKAALAEIVAFEKASPKMAKQLLNAKYSYQVATNDPEASKTGAKIVDEAIAKKNASALNEIAWGIVDPAAETTKRDLDLAFKAADAAVKFTDGKDAAVLDTLARVYFWKGDKAKAIEVQTKAVAVAEEGMMKDELTKVLEEYKAK